jgi:dTDP-4-dehydrorhamnose 3,5-epimerase
MPPENDASSMRKEPDCFVEGQICGVDFKALQAHTDHRGWLAEIYREDELPGEIHPVMSYLSETLPGAARGPHEHAHQTDYFVFAGPGVFVLYLWDARAHSPTWANRMKVVVGQSNPQIVIVPPGVVHAYKNIGSTPGWVLNYPNRLYGGAAHKGAVDEIRHENRPDNPFVLD